MRTEQYIRKKRRTAKKRRRQLSVAIAAVLLIGIIVSVILVIRSCGSKDLFKGTWDLDGITVYQFDGKGNGALILPGNTYSFTYTIKGDSISIDFESEAARDVTYVFTVEKEKLLIKAENHTEATYELTKRNDG